MYSVVLMMALSGSAAEQPAGLFNRGCSGCSGCYGCNGCGGGCRGSSCGGCRGGFLFGKRGGCKGCNGCNGCSGYSCCGSCGGGYGCHGAGYGCSGASCHGCGGGAVQMPAPEKKPEKIKKPPEEKEAAQPAPATIVVTLPAAATLAIDDHVTTSTSAVRSFVSPALEQGKTYVYTLTAKIEGKSITKEVTVTAGAEARVTFEASEAVAAR
jgi:uncharacterized protein (TIGR03000 family)